MPGLKVAEMKLTFYLVRPTAATSTIALRSYGKAYTGRKFVYSTGLAIAPGFWDAPNQKPTTDRTTLRLADKISPTLRGELKNIGVQLDKIRAAAISHGHHCEYTGEPITSDSLRAFLDETIKGKESEADRGKLEIDDYLAQYVAGIKDGTRRNNGKAYKPASVRSYVTFLNRWGWYRAATGNGATWESVTMSLYHELTDFYTNERGLGVNSVGDIIKKLKAVMRAAYEEGHHENDVFRSRSFRKVSAKSFSIALTQDEVLAIYRHPLDAAHLATARDLFVLGCYTAQRFSDYSRISDAQHLREIDGGTFYQIRQRKTGKRVLIPRHPIAAEILARYGGAAPKVYQQKVNDRIKTIARLAGISRPVLTNEGSEGAKVYKARCELITTHTARRTGATMLHEAGLSLAEIMGITGHSSEGQLRTYLKLDAVQLAQSSARNPFFTDKRGAV